MTAVLPAREWEWERLEAASPWGRRPQKIGALHGFLTPKGEIALIAAGNHYEKNRIATLISRLTAPREVINSEVVTIPCTWANVVQIGWTFGQIPDLAWVPDEKLRAWMAEESDRRHASLPELEPSWPPWLEPRGYQVEGARMIAAARKFFLLDDMGLGKSIVTLLGLEQIRRTGDPVFPLVILVPSWDVADGWHREITRWMPAGHWHEPVFYEGTARTRLLRHPGVNVIISTYATARLDAADARGPLVTYAAASVVVDEASLIKNARAKQAQATERIAKNARNVIFLSGTLITRDTGDAFPALKTADPGTWSDKGRFRDRFCLTRKGEFEEIITGLNPATTAEFRACLLGQMVRRAKADVDVQLPPKEYSVLRPEIPGQWMRAYREMEEDMLAALPDGGELSVMDTLTQLTRLSQLASSAADVRTEMVPVIEDGVVIGQKPKQVVTLRYPSWKAESLMGILARATAPVVVFMASRQLAVITGERYLRPAGYRFGYVIGEGPLGPLRADGTVTRGSRRAAIGEFQDRKMDALICTAGAGGVGITLTAADTVVFLQRPWPYDQAVQPEDRVHRFGQLAERIHIIDIVAKGTVDQRVRDLLRHKAGQLSEFVRDPRIVRDLLGGKR